MKNKSVCLIIVLLSLFNMFAESQSVSYSQNQLISAAEYAKWDSMSLTYLPPANFKGTLAISYNLYISLPHIKQLFIPYYITSKDQNFLICFRSEGYDPNDTVTKKGNDLHLISIKKDLADSLFPNINESDSIKNAGDRAKIQLRDHVTYHSPEYAKQSFNADTVISYKLNMQGHKIKDRYTDNNVLVLQKNGRGYITIYCFYTQKGKKELDKYMKQIENMFWYRQDWDMKIRVVPFSSLPKETIIN